MSAEVPLSAGALAHPVSTHPVSATPVVAVAVVLLVLAVTSVLLISWLFYWRSGKR